MKNKNLEQNVIMSKRITLISFIEKNEIRKVEQLMENINESTCKVPYGINDEKRYEDKKPHFLRRQDSCHKHHGPFLFPGK